MNFGPNSRTAKSGKILTRVEKCNGAHLSFIGTHSSTYTDCACGRCETCAHAQPYRHDVTAILCLKIQDPEGEPMIFDKSFGCIKWERQQNAARTIEQQSSEIPASIVSSRTP